MAKSPYNNDDFTNEMEKQLLNCTDADRIILEWLLDRTLYNFVKCEYDSEYTLPYTRN